MVLVGRALRKCLNCEGGALQSGISVSEKRLWTAPEPLLSGERAPAVTQEEGLTGEGPHWHLDLRIPRLQNCEPKSLLFTRPPVCAALL